MSQPAAPADRAEDLSVIGKLLPTDPQAGVHASGQLEVVHLLHVLAHWLMVPVAAGAALWMVALLVVLLAWSAWGLLWLVRRPFHRAKPL